VKAPILPFYFDYACPWAYMGSCRVESYFRHVGAQIDFRPVRLADLKEPAAGPAPEAGPRKKKAYADDFRHWAEVTGAEFSPEVRSLPRPDTTLLLQAALVARDEGRFRDFHYPAFRARWAGALDVAKPEVVARLLAGAGLDADAALIRAQEPALEARLEADTREAIDRGVFGVPTIFVGDEMFWGNDRFEVVRHYLEKAGAH
jgi:2-hydroxychromene-2-carboxylate isomerase